MIARPLAALALVALGAPAGLQARPIAPAGSPVAFHKTTRWARVELRLPAGLSAWPALRQSLLTSDTAKLNGFVRHATPQDGAGATAGEGAKPSRKAERRSWRTIDYMLAGTTARLASVIRTDDAYTGGAHPLPSISGVIWDQATKRRLPLAALFRPDVDSAPLDKALCDAVKAEKAERENAVPIDGRNWRCPDFSQASAVLAPSTVTGKAGGLIVLFSPYEVGPYAEGEYRVVLPQAAFRRGLRRSALADFAGSPAKAVRKLTRTDGVAARAPSNAARTGSDDGA